MKRLLITGGAGFIGANFCHYWSRAYPTDRLVVLDALTYAGNLASIGELIDTRRLRFVRGDIADCDRVVALLNEEDIDTIVNFAAESHVDRSIENPEIFLRTNVMGTYSLVEAARRAWTGFSKGVRRFHHVSTDEVYGSLAPQDPAFTESTPYAPNSPYSASKAAADHIVRAYGQTYGLPCTISNCSNNYGPYQFPEKLVPQSIVNILEGRPVPIYGDGQQVRDWLHVSDHCLAIDVILQSSPPGETWNLGGGSTGPNLHVVETLCDMVDREFAEHRHLATRYPQSAPAQGRHSRSLIQHVRDRLGHDRRYAVNSKKIAALGFAARTTLDAGLAATVQWYLANEPWWKAVVTGEYRNRTADRYATGA